MSGWGRGMQRRWLSRGIGLCIAVIVVSAGYAAQPARAAGTVRTVNTCTNGDISGNQFTGSLDALLAASGNGDTILFSVDCSEATTPIIPPGELIINPSITIDGAGHTIAVDGGSANRVFRIAGTAAVTLSNLTITNGLTGDGGGILNFGTLTINNCTLTGNIAGGNGGGIRSDGTLTVTNSTISNNTASGSAGSGGGIRVNQGSATFANVTISGNSAAGNGGGIATGGGTVTLTNTIVAGNTDTTIGHLPSDISGAVAAASKNDLIGDAATSGGLTNGASGNFVGIAPVLAPLANYAGATQTVALLPGSPAIDAGDDSTCAAAPVGGVDERGVARTQGARCDIGAFESQGFSLAPTSGSGQSAAPNAAFTDPLVVTVASSHNEPVQNGIVAFTGPATGAGLQSSPLIGTAGGNGQASVTPTAGGTAGSYSVIAAATGTTPPAVSFALTNTGATPQTYTVTTTDDTPIDANCTAICTLRQAINASNANDPGTGNHNAIQFAAGGIGTTMLTDDANHGTLVPSRDVTIDGSGNSVTIDGGGAVQLVIVNSGVHVALNALTFANGSSPGGAGGAINNNGTLTVTNSTFSGNHADSGGAGGAINNGNGGTLTIANSTFAANHASGGGAIVNTGGGTATVTNATFSGNSDGNGATGGTIVNNPGGTLTLTNTIVAGSTNSSDLSGAIAGNDNLIDDSSGTLTGSGNRVNQSALLSVLGGYDSTSQTFAPLPGSPAIDAGDDATCTAAPISGLDQRGIARPQGARCDIGAFESRGFSLVVTGGSGQSAAPNAAFANPLVVSVASAQSEPVDGGGVTFTGPGTNADIIPDPQAATIAGGQASIMPTANGTGGAYSVAAAATGTTPASVSFTLTNVAPITLSPTVLPAATTGVVYSQTISASGGSGIGYTFAVTNSSLPVWLHLDTATGALTGTPPSAADSPFAFTITATDSQSSTGSQAYTLAVTVVASLDTIADPALIARDAGAQTINLTGIGGSGALTVTATSGNPALLADPTVTYISPNPTGSLAYTPVAGQSGSALVTVTVADSNASTIQRTFTVTVNIPPMLDTITAPAAIAQNAGQQTVNLTGIATGGETQTLVVMATSGNHALLADPAVTYASPNATGSLTYVPIAGQHGTALVTVTVNDGLNTATRTFTVTVNLLSNQTYTVGTTSDTGGAASVADCATTANTTCRLRDAIGFATSGTDTVAFNGSGRGIIALTSTLTLGTSVAISGPTSGAGVTVSGGGAVGVFVVNSGVTASIGNLTIAGGSAANGGAILNNDTLALTNSTLTGNHAGGNGGAILNNGTLTVTSSTFSGNDATSGGAIFNDGALTVTNSTLNGNTVTGSGASGGGGLGLHTGTATLANTIIAGNTTAGSAPDDINGPLAVTSGANNLIGNVGSSGGLTDLMDGNIVGHSALLAALGDHGGTTQTIALLPGSPALGGGTSGGVGIPTTDQRGVARTGHNDIGAFQSQGFTLTLAGGTPQSVLVTTAFGPLTVGVAAIQAATPFNEPVAGGQVTFTAPTLGASVQTTTVIATISSGQASITPAANGASGSYTVNVTLSAAGTPSVAFALTNTAPTVTLAPETLPNGTVASPYTATFRGDGGTVPYSFSVTVGALPNGLTLATDGVVSGAPTAPTTATFTVQAKDADNFTGTRQYSITVVTPANQTYTVGTTSDSGGTATFAACTTAANATCRLRDALGYALSGADIIVFNSTGRGTIGLGSTLTLGASVTISGPSNGSGVTISGGGLARVFIVNSGATVNISSLTIANGATTNDAGGGILNNGNLALLSSTISGNTATGSGGSGGGIFNTGTLTLTNCTFSGNAATNGGGLFNTGTLTVTNSTFSGNSAQTEDGGIGLGAGAAMLTNTIVAGNTRGGSTPDDINGSAAVANGSVNNLIGSGGSGGLVDGAGGNIVGHSALLGPLAAYSSANGTQSLALLPGSPAIGGGTASGAPANDQRGVARTGHTDIGAFQSQGFSLALTSGSGQTTAPNATFGSPLVVTVSSTHGEPVQNGVVTFTGPGGAGIQNSPLAGTIAATKQASVTPTANGVAGSYSVIATAAGTTPVSASFSLTNIAVALNAIGDPARVAQNAGQQTINLTGIAGAAPVTVTATSGNHTLLADPTVTYTSPGATGSLAYTPVANQSGSAVVTVTVTDAGSHTAVRTFTVRVNMPPALGAINNPAPIARNAGQQTVNLAGISDGGTGENQTLTITATSNNHALLADPVATYTSPQATGALTYTPIANQSGSTVVTVTVNDGLNTAARTFTVLVTSSGQTYTVGTTADHPAGTPASIAECTSAMNTTCALRDALGYAISGTDTIIFKGGLPGIITLTNGALTLTTGVTITGPGAATLAVDGNNAARVFVVNSGVHATISGLTVQHGNAGAASGGGIVNDGSLTLTAVAISHNTAPTAAGIRNDAGGTLTLTSSAVTANTATGDAGGIGNAGGTVAATNSTISGNTAGGSGVGGGINSSGTLTLTNSTVSANTASGGGGVNVAGGVATLTNTIVAGNTQGGAPSDIGGLVAGGSSNNLTGTGGSGGLVDQTTDPAHRNKVGVAAPGLDTLKGNGGPTQSVALLASSPAIAAGDHAVCAAAPVGGVDQRGLPRPAVCAIGAFEPQVALTAISAPSGSASGGTPITLRGTGFATGATVTFGATAATNVAVVDTTTITATIPAHAAGVVNVTVTTGGVTKTLTAAYTYGAVNPITPPQPVGPTVGVPSPRPGTQPSGVGPDGAVPNPLPPPR
jgi:fibronectin-binding autotransporter adhesin